MGPDDLSALVDSFFSNPHSTEAYFLVTDSCKIVRESDSCKQYYTDFGSHTVQTWVLQASSLTEEQIVEAKWICAIPEAILANAGLDKISLTISASVLSSNSSVCLVTIRPSLSYTELRSKYAILRNLAEHVDGALTSSRLNVLTGLSTTQFATRQFFELSHANPDNLSIYGLAEIGCRVNDNDRECR
jgi:hypothetical protein